MSPVHQESFVALNNCCSFSQRILVATNLFGRGMDIERVNIVFNYDMPEDSDTYLHRVARAGRFGTKVSSNSVKQTPYQTFMINRYITSSNETNYPNLRLTLYKRTLNNTQI